MPKKIIKPIDANLEEVSSALVKTDKKQSAKASSSVILVQDSEIHIIQREDEDYISLTDMTQNFNGAEQLIKNWLQNKNTIDFLGVWEQLNNPNFNLVEFHQIKIEVGLNRFVMSAKLWIQRTNGIGIIAKAGRYGGTFAHKDIAFEFGSWLSPEFKLYLIKEFQRLKELETKSDWSVRRILAKAHYRIHTNAVKDHLIPPMLDKRSKGYIYANEADMLNKALFGITAKEWKTQNPKLQGNIRDYATIEQLVVLSVMESQNALLIEQKVPQEVRLAMLNNLAIKHMRSLIETKAIQALQDKPLLD